MTLATDQGPTHPPLATTIAGLNPLASPDVWDSVSDAYVADTVPFFEQYASAALDLAMLPPQRTILDVASGPGTLALIAEARGHQVTAIDFAPAMLAHLRSRMAMRGAKRLVTDLGDGQALNYADASFDAAFSMFGLMFFSDRAAGFRELYRVLRPTGRATVSAWTPAESVPTLRALYAAIRGVMTGLAFGDGEPPLSNPIKMRNEMAAAGFVDVVVQEVSFEHLAPDVDTFWDSMCRGSVPLVALRKKLGEQWSDFALQARERFRAQVEDGPVAVRWPAILGVGKKPVS
jgi:SAM-dependent methyltransferase